MPFKRAPMRYAHANGYTDCVYSEDGEYILTCGSDGDIRKWAGIDDDDPISQCVGEYTLCIVQYDERMLVSTDLNTVQAYTYPHGDRDGTEFRFKANVTCIKVNSKYLAACSEDMEIKVAPLDKSEPSFDLIGHKGIVLKIDLSPNGYLASSSGDGTIKIWKLDEKLEIKSIDALPKIKAFSSAKNYATLSFEPISGRYLAYPQNKQINFLETNNWELSFSLTDSNVTSDYTVCSFSPCGKYLAAGTSSGEISIWDIKKHSLINGDTKGSDSQAITAMVWNPQNNGELAYCDINGELGTIVDGKSKESDKTSSYTNSIAEKSDDVDDILFANDYELDNADDADNENCVSLEKLKNETLNKFNIQSDNEEDEVKSEHAMSKSDQILTERLTMMKEYKQQPPFQSGSSPSHLEHRYLVWNHIGIVRAHKTDIENSIEVEFHDVSIHHGIHMNNYLHHTMASLSSTVLALSGETPCKLVCIALGSSGSREWSMDMPNCEEVLAVTTSEKLVAVATDSRFLRLFSVMGTQREVFSIPGPVLALAGYKDKILVAYHSGPASVDQNISVMMVQTIGLTLRCRDVKLPLTPKSKLMWIGYTDRGSPAILDSLGLLSIYSTKSNIWLPSCDTTLHVKGASDSFFIIEVSEEYQLVRAVLCRGSLYPLTNPRPVVNELPMQLPLCEIETEKSKLEETLVRYANFDVENCDKHLMETAITLFALACRTEMETRAKELIEIIGSPQLLSLAVKYASKLGRIHLAEKLNDLIPIIEEQENEMEKSSTLARENDLIMYEHSIQTSMLLQRSIEKAPVIAPKPMLISQKKRNPFKRGISTTTPTNNNKGGNVKENPLSHLTNNVIGLEKNESEDIIEAIPIIEKQTVKESSKENNVKKKNENVKNPPSENKFMKWFNENKEELQLEHPETSAAELTKLAMRKFKSLSTETPNKTGTGKRKLENENEEKSSGISKLARFGFNKI